MNDDPMQGQVDLIREVFMYAHRFKGKRFVFQIGSHIIEDSRFPALVRDLSILHKAGIKIILVPGAGKRIDDVLERYGVETQRINGVRVSSYEAMPLIKMAAFDMANMVMTQLASQQVDAVIGNWVRARSIGVNNGVDFQGTGSVYRVNLNLLDRVLEDNLVPILPCIGWSGSGKPYNISSLELASLLAEQVQAEKLFFVSDGLELRSENHQTPAEGLVTRDGLITRLSAPAADQFLVLNKPSVPNQDVRWNGEELAMELVRLAAHAARNGVERIHLLNGRLDGVVLKEIFSTIGMGTMVHADPFDSIRPMRSGDIPEVLRIMEPNIEKGILVRRDENDLLSMYKDFVVYETDGTIRGCAALHAYPEGQAEIAGLAVDPAFAYLGAGQKMVRFLVEKAQLENFDQVFLLTTQTGDFFELLGFKQDDLDSLPETKKQHYNLDRKSRIYLMPLN